MNQNVKILIWIVLGSVYIISYIVYRLVIKKYKKKHKKQYNSLCIVGSLLIIFQILCYFIKPLMDFQIGVNLCIVGLYPFFLIRCSENNL
ncbi:hypothetical protein NRP93_002448 [Clostridium botulinum]|nr:hypothetical protein [Clostridium botulinum]